MSSLEFEQVQQLIPKALTLIFGIMELTSKTEKPQPQEILNLLRGITPQDLVWASYILKSIKTKKRLTIPSHVLPGQNERDSARYLLQAILKTVTYKNLPSSEELLDTLHIKDPVVKKEFTEEYKRTLEQLKRTKVDNPVDTRIFLWARLGKLLLYTNVVIIVLIILRKLYELLLHVTYGMRKAIAKFILPKWKKFKKHRRVIIEVTGKRSRSSSSR
jgi:hypothetical protein